MQAGAISPGSAVQASYPASRFDALMRIGRPLLNVHRPGSLPNVFVFSLPRSGSTWLMELVWSQPGFKHCNEPTDLRHPLVRKHLGINEWHDLYQATDRDQLRHYFEGFCEGRLGFLNPRPFYRYYRPYTNRIVFKIIHGCEDRLNWFADQFDGRVVYLVRHPIAVSLSREGFPTLQAMLSSNYRQHFSDAQLRYADAIAASGSKLEQGVLSWCLQTAMPLRQQRGDWVVVSYEQLILEPEPVIQELQRKLVLPKPQRMLEQLMTPSRSTWKSDGSTRQMLDGDQPARAQRLVEKWRDHVSPSEERRLMEILERFEIDVYTTGNALPSERVWIAPEAT